MAKTRRSWKRFVKAACCRDRIFMRDKLKNINVYGEVTYMGNRAVYITPEGAEKDLRFFNWESAGGRYGIYRSELPARIAVKVNRKTD